MKPPSPTSPQSPWPFRILLLFAIVLAGILVAREFARHDTVIGHVLKVPPRWHGKMLEEWLAAAELAWKVGKSPTALKLLRKLQAGDGELRVRAALTLCRIDNDPEARRIVHMARFDTRP